MKWLVGIALATLALTQYELHALNSSVSVLVRTRMEDTQIASARWRETNGVANSIATYREVMESEAEFVRRHMQAVREMAKVQGEDAQTTREERR